MANGIPSLPSGVSSGLLLLSALATDTIIGLAGLSQPQWGIFSEGEPIIAADITVSLGYKQSWNIADYPLENGAFQSYDKVDTPFLTRVRLATGGSEADRQAFLNSIAAIAGDTNLYDVVTPEQIFTNVNIESYEFVRSASSNLGIIAVDITLIEIRVGATSDFSNTSQPSGASSQDGGTVQTSTPTSAQSSSDFQ